VKTPLLALLVAALAGCTHASVRVASDGATTTTSTSVSAGYSGHGSAGMWLLIGIGLIAWEYGGSEGARERGLEPERKPATPLDASRKVNEVDCTKPIEDWSGNLKCK
jgi:hypothetical protein